MASVLVLALVSVELALVLFYLVSIRNLLRLALVAGWGVGRVPAVLVGVSQGGRSLFSIMVPGLARSRAKPPPH